MPRFLGFLVAASLMLAAGAASAGPVEDAIAAAMRDAEAGRCDQAVRRLEGVEGLESRALLLGGQCRVGQGLYPEALSDLDRAARAGGLSEQQMADVELYRGIALYHLERYAEAETALDNAFGLTSDEAQLSLYRGLILLRRNDNERAASDLEKAARLNPGVVEPVASYYAGLAWQGASERSKARDALKRVVELDPDGPWGREAEKLLETTELLPYYVQIRAGSEYDDNVLLRATGRANTRNNGTKDWRGVWQLDTGVQLFSSGPWSGGLLGSYYGNAHVDLTDFDTHYPTIGGFLDHRFGRDTVGRLRYDFGHAWIDKGSFLRSNSVQAGVTHTWERAGTTEAVVDVTINDFRFLNDFRLDGPGNTGDPCGFPPGTTVGCSPPGVLERVERDRDGEGYGAAIEHRYLVPVDPRFDDYIESFVLRGSYRISWYDSQGTEWEGLSNIFSLGFNVQLPYGFSFDAQGTYERYDYDNPSTFPDFEIANVQYGLDSSDREEDAAFVETELEKDLNEFLSVTARYSYYSISSNVRVYQYRRHIGGLYLNYRFD